MSNKTVEDDGLSPEAFGVLLKRIESLELRLKEMERFQDITHEQYKAKKSPHRCPICDGDGTYREDGEIYNGRSCNACEGKGIVWG